MRGCPGGCPHRHRQAPEGTLISIWTHGFCFWGLHQLPSRHRRPGSSRAFDGRPCEGRWGLQRGARTAWGSSGRWSVPSHHLRTNSDVGARPGVSTEDHRGHPDDPRLGWMATRSVADWVISTRGSTQFCVGSTRGSEVIYRSADR